MDTRFVRATVLGVCALGVVAMIVASALDADGAALTFGLVTAASVVCLIVATAVAGGAAAVDEQRAARVEALISDLVAGGADESAVRALVREASGLRSTGA